MKIKITDQRHEDRIQRTEIGATELQTFTGGAPHTSIGDVREVRVLIEEHGATAIGTVPETLPVTSWRDRHVNEIFVGKVEINWSRSQREDKSGRWVRNIMVTGSNRKKDGTPGLKHGVVRYPSTHEEPDGVYTADDIDWASYERHHGTDRDAWSGYVRRQTIEKVGQEKTKTVDDPLPDWLAYLVDKTHPVTGETPFTYGDTHVYGSFASAVHA